MDKTIKLDLSAIGEGSLQEKVDKELEKIFGNNRPCWSERR